MEKSIAEQNALEEARRLQAKEQSEKDKQRSKELRAKSKSIFNAYIKDKFTNEIRTKTILFI